MNDIIADAASFLWGWPMIILLLGTHLLLTIRLRFPQRHIFKGIRMSISHDKGADGDMSQFAALATSLAATIGTGNIVGVATAIALGGPGAVFWCWISGLLGIATKYSEALLAVKYREITPQGKMLGGPMYALEKGLNMKWLGVLFCTFTAIAAFGIGNMVQSNAIAVILEESYGIESWITGVIVAVMVGVVLLGGVKILSRVCSALVPLMALFYVLGCFYILCLNANFILPAIKLIVVNAFEPQAVGGGLVGGGLLLAIRYGVARGLFSNESGMGSAPIVAAAAKTHNPVRQALVSSTGTFWDTVIICALTGIVLVSTSLKHPEIINTMEHGTLTQAAFASIPVIGTPLLSVGIITFAFSTILGWSYYGERSIEYLAGHKLIILYRLLFVLAVFLGSTTQLVMVWNLADLFNALMAIPNLVALILLSGVVVSETKNYFNKYD